MSPALRVAIASLIALLSWQALWHGALAPARPGLFVPTLVLVCAPLLFSLWLAARAPARGVLVGGMFCLLYFAHGIGVLWNGAAPRWPAAVEVALTLAVVFAMGWHVRAAKRRTGNQEA